MENKRQDIELQTIFNDYREEFLGRNSKLCLQQRKAYLAILSCRTPRLGGFINECNNCGNKQQSYRSCRNRHCPKCQFTKQAQWVNKVKCNLPKTRYFHVIFTVPQALHALFYINQQACYTMLFKAAAETLRQTALMPNLLGAETGAVAILHTWGQALTNHPHLHMIVPAGGISSDQAEWISSPKDFLLPVKVMSRIFRGILCRMIEKQWDKELKKPDFMEQLIFPDFKKVLYRKKWNVNARKSFNQVEKVVEYLGNYTHRVAISNKRIKEYDGKKVTFEFKNYKTGTRGQMTLDAREFISRFLRHVLPCGFYKIRYYGIFAQANSKTKHQLSFTLLEVDHPIPSLEGLTAQEVYQELTGMDPFTCKKCRKGKMVNTIKIKARVPG